MQTLAATTELDAVNIMLGTIGESPVATLTGATAMVDVDMAVQVLREVTTQVQEEGWHFNTETNWPLTPALDTGEIALPANCIQIDATTETQGLDVVARGTRLYNRVSHSYSFSGTLLVDMVVLLPFEEIPQAARHYIAVRAARVYQQRMVGSQTLGAFSDRDEARARSALRKLDANTADYNILNGSWSVTRVLNR